MKKVISIILCFLLISLTAIPAFAAEDGAVLLAAPDSADAENDGETNVLEELAGAAQEALDSVTIDKEGGVKFTKEKAGTTALTSAKAKFAIEGVSADIAEKAVITKMKYNKKSNTYSVTVRANRVHKYVCTIKITNILGNELGMPDDSEYTKHNALSGFFGQGCEKFSYFFIRLFKGDGPKE